jgi:hypothetical protein
VPSKSKIINLYLFIIEAEPEDTCLYKCLKLDYHYGLGKIYPNEEIEKAAINNSQYFQSKTFWHTLSLVHPSKNNN